MIAQFNRTWPVLLIAAVAIFPARVLAQLSIPGKVLTYRTVDTDSGAELVRIRVREAADGRGGAEVSEATYPSGTRVISQCAFANGLEKPATSFR
jgi:hypothetical protein